MDCQEPGSEEVLCLLITGDHLLQRVVKAWIKKVFLSTSHRNERGSLASEQSCHEVAQRASAYYYTSTACDNQLSEDVRTWVWVRHRLTAVCRALRWSNPSRPVGEEPCQFTPDARRGRGWEQIFFASVRARENRSVGASSSSSEPLLPEQHQRIAQAVISAVRERLVRDFRWRRLLQVFEAWGQAANVIPTAPAGIASESGSDGPPTLVSDDSSARSELDASDSPSWDSESDSS